VGLLQRIRELLATLRGTARAAPGEVESTPQTPMAGSRGGRAARPPARPRPAPEPEPEQTPAQRGEAQPEPGAGAPSSVRRARLARWLEDPETLRDAVALREILAPPVALRGRRARRTEPGLPALAVRESRWRKARN